MSDSISNKDIYEMLEHRMDRFEDSIAKEIGTIQTRVSILEKTFSNLTGKVTIGVLVVGTFVGVLSKFVVDFFERIKG